MLRVNGFHMLAITQDDQVTARPKGKKYRAFYSEFTTPLRSCIASSFDVGFMYCLYSEKHSLIEGKIECSQHNGEGF